MLTPPSPPSRYLVEDLMLDINAIDSYGSRPLDIAKRGGVKFREVRDYIVNMGGEEGFPEMKTAGVVDRGETGL